MVTQQTGKKSVAEINAALYAFDNTWRDTLPIICSEAPVLCGVDEAGRGPLCGPVSVAAVILNAADPIDGLNDSKKLNPKKREALYDDIIARALAYHVVLVDAATIDEINILQATLCGMRQAVQGLSIRPGLALIDGTQCPNSGVAERAVVRGDATSACIAAASILAKVTRDRYMTELAVRYPQYKLEQHKGYPTKGHYALLDQYGIAPFYRRSFLKKRGYTDDV